MKVLDIDGLDYYNSLIENKYAPIASPAFTGTPTAPTPTAGDNTTKLATTAFVKDAVDTKAGDYLPLSGGTMTGKITWTQGEIGYRGTTHTNPSNVCKQMIITAGTVDGAWNDGNAKLALHTYDDTGTNLSENGAFVLVASDVTDTRELQGNPDGTLTWDGNNVITSAGGTMTGAITKSGSSGVIRRDTDDSFLYIGGSTSDSKGAYLALYGRDHSNEGRFVLAAKSVTDATTLIGYAGGTLTWNGKNVERVNASSSDYIRFESGLQICWGSAQTTTSGHTYNFPVSFNTSPKVAFSVGNTTESNTSYSTKVTNLSKTSFKGICSSTSNSGQNITCTYIAVGFWK